MFFHLHFYDSIQFNFIVVSHDVLVMLNAGDGTLAASPVVAVAVIVQNCFSNKQENQYKCMYKTELNAGNYSMLHRSQRLLVLS